MEVRRAGQVVPLEPKALDVLSHLMANADRVVTKDELLDLCWRETFVTPNVLTRAIAQLRKALGDDAFEARYIETVSKRGYRFISLASALEDPAWSRPDAYAGPTGVSWLHRWLFTERGRMRLKKPVQLRSRQC